MPAPSTTDRPQHILSRLFLTAFILLCTISGLRAQKYIFSHFNIEDGLVQSQVNKFSQDKSHCLWIGTLGGACRYDGKEFTSYSKENGLVNNFIYTILCDKNNRTWFGSHMGIACLNGEKLINYPLPKNIKRTWVTNIAEDHAGNIWTVIDSKLFKVAGNALQYVPITGVEGFSVTNITVNKAGVLHAAVYQKGIYRLQAKQWTNRIPFTGECKKIVFDNLDSDKAYILSYNKLFVASNSTISAFAPTQAIPEGISLLSLTQDTRGNLWIGSSNGAYYVKNTRLIHFNAQNGLTDASVSDIYCDNDNNTWLATWGDGFYKYEGDAYVVFDQGTEGFKSIMGIAPGKQHSVFMVSDGKGLIQYDGKGFKSISLPGSIPYNKKMQCIYTDRDSTVWIGTSLGGLWSYDGHRFSMVPKSDDRVANAINQDNTGTIWMAAPLGCFYYDKGSLQRLDHLNEFVSSLLPLGKDSMLIGTQNGVKLAVNKKLADGFKLPALASSNIFCLIHYGKLIVFGTADRGIFIWDRANGRVKNYNVDNGLNSNSIYNLTALKNNTLWAGTGRGLNRLVINPVTLNCKVLGSDDVKELIAEANQNAVLYNDNKVWMGTTRGLLIYNLNARATPPSKPYIAIQSVKIYDPQSSTSDNAKMSVVLNEGAKIPYDKNHITISYLGVYLKNAANVTYQYRLSGLEDKFCAPVKNTMVDYPSLPPGQYTFQVKALILNGIPSDNIAKFSFEIIPPFYQTWIFKALLLLLFIFIGISVQTYIHERRLRSAKLIEQMKLEEKQKIRKQTAEDFHDDLGNKLTRITVLSDILASHVDDKNADQKKIIGQIKQNAEALYLGTKDILWALDPKSDNLYEILIHIKNFGIELFQDTTIEFSFNNIDLALSGIKLPMEYSRNITMIFKELLNNVLKHAKADKVDIALLKVSNNEVNITLTDNGRGFDPDNVTTGHGMANIKNRAARIGGTIDIWSGAGIGTRVTLNLKNLTSIKRL
jgi:signal transduction histidine kinase/ligand-binding sensor domain-containing protein